MHISDRTFLTTISLLVVIAIASTAYIFLIQKDYIVIVEASCDPVENICFSRDCSGGDCPYNELEQYRIFSIHAHDFSTCDDHSCLQECERGIIACNEIVCGESEEDQCMGPSDLNIQ